MWFWAQKIKLSFAKTSGKKPKCYQHIFDAHKAEGLLSSSMWQHWWNTFCHVTCLGFLLPLNASHGYQVCPLHLINSLLQRLWRRRRLSQELILILPVSPAGRQHASVPKANVPWWGICIQRLRVIDCQARVPVIVNCCRPCDYKIKKGANCSSCQSNCFLPW